MSNELKPQTPGENPAQDLTLVDSIAGGNVAELVEALPDLSDEDLNALEAAEGKGKKRTGALDAIVRERAHRADAAQLNPKHDGSDVTPIGDTADADKPASAVDPKSIERPTLTRDGWVLPLPKAQPKV